MNYNDRIMGYRYPMPGDTHIHGNMRYKSTCKALLQKHVDKRCEKQLAVFVDTRDGYPYVVGIVNFCHGVATWCEMHVSGRVGEPVALQIHGKKLPMKLMYELAGFDAPVDPARKYRTVNVYAKRL